jgi:uncharacterized protein (DUF58 family)
MKIDRRLFDREFFRALERLLLESEVQPGGFRREGERGSRKGGRQDFVGHRPYAWGDPHRDLDWNIYARSRQWWVKEYTLPQQKHCRVFLDDSRSMDFGDFGRPSKWDQSRRVVALWTLARLAEGGRVGLHRLSGSDRPFWSSGRDPNSALEELLGCLSVQEVGGGGPPAWGMERGGRSSSSDEILFVSDLWGEPPRPAGGREEGWGWKVICLRTFFEQEPFWEGERVLVDLEEGRNRSVWMSAHRRDLYRRERDAHLRRWRRFVRRSGGTLSLVSTGRPLLEGMRAVQTGQDAF